MLFALICAAGLFASDDASARDYASRNVGSWTVVASNDGKGCFLTRDYDRNGGTTLLLGLDTDGANRLSVLNANWSIKPQGSVEVEFSPLQQQLSRTFCGRHNIGRETGVRHELR